MQITNKYNLPQAIMNFATRREYNPGKSDITVSRLIDSPRRTVLTKKHNHELTIDITELTAAMLGTALHHIFEVGADETSIPEERLFLKVNGWDISGQIDSQVKNGDEISLIDYKSTSAWAVMNEKPEWTYQVNLYAYLVEKVKNIRVSDATIVVLIKDWKQRETIKEGYPEASILNIPIVLWPMEQREAYLMERLRIHTEADTNIALGGEIPLCTPEEQWRSAETYAVVKDANPTRAWRVFPVLTEAQAFAEDKKGITIITRKAEPKRCNDWCKVAAHCDQYQQEKEA